MSISEYYQQLSGNSSGITFTSGYTCSGCGQWVNLGEYHTCGWGISYPYYPIYSPCPNPTERAYQIIKKLVELKTIPEPDSYKKFCELIDAIAKVL